jgi:hypothetical protein
MIRILLTAFMASLLCLGSAATACGQGLPTPSHASAAPAGTTSAHAEDLPAPALLRQWIAEMKEAPRGPFQRIRWFCKDGAILPPQPFACKDHGGGVQHGEWSERVKGLRAHGYLIANVLAAIDPATFRKDPAWLPTLKQILLEQFLIEADDGWIFRQARYYSGALQTENENAAGRALLLELLTDRSMGNENFLVLREAVRLLPHGRRGVPLIEMRQLARAIEDKDPQFTPLRVKLHVRPDPTDAVRVRAYAASTGKSALTGEYHNLAAVIDEVYTSRNIAEGLNQAASRSTDAGLARALKQAAALLAAEQDPFRRFAAVAAAMSEIRQALTRAGSASRKLELLDLSLDLEREAFQLGNQWLDRLGETDRRGRLDWLQGGFRVVYGMGLISRRELDALGESLQQLAAEPLPVATYKAELDNLARISEWSENTPHFHFRQTIDHLATLDPLFERYIPDRLRGSPLVVLISVLDSLRRDAGRLVGIRHQVFGAPVSSGLRALNPGLARGTLRLYRAEDSWQPQAIYLLPETLAELPPLAGILTEGRGNSLSHVQMLARNLGIPNVAVEHQLAAQLRSREGQPLVLAASPAGVVELAEDSPRWDKIFQPEPASAEWLIRPDLAKLDLASRDFIPLRNLRAADSGRLVGPKAAHLGELKSLYPDLVSEGLAIPFGLFRQHLEQPIEPGGPTAFQWMRQQYAALRRLEDPQARALATTGFLHSLREWIVTSDPGPEFTGKLRAAMARTFGPEGSYGVFVRSDTNVEDLPGFSGAGLNLTVPHLVGFDNVLQAIRQVWASPFSERAYAWRQGHMDQPEHIYASVLLMKSVPAEKSGVMVTADVETGGRQWLTVAVNEGVGGAVDGQRAEELLIERGSGRVRLLARAGEPLKRVLRPGGGVVKIPASGRENILSSEEIRTLVRMADSLPGRFPGLVDAGGQPAPADIEFGFAGGRFALFQIRPFLESSRARRSLYLQRLDNQLEKAGARFVDLAEIPREEGS